MIVDRYIIEASDPHPTTPQLGIGETILQTTKEISKTIEKVPKDLLLSLGDKLKKKVANTPSCLPVASKNAHGY
jgi:hypothetical protein